MEVLRIHWPEEAGRRDSARRSQTPRLLLVAPDADAPRVTDPLEDWIRLPALDGDVKVRVATLEVRARERVLPALDGDGILRFADRRVALSPVERQLVQEMTRRFGHVVSRDTLMRAAWPSETPSRNALDVHVLRLRRRVSSIGLEIRTVRSRGYLLEAATTPWRARQHSDSNSS